MIAWSVDRYGPDAGPSSAGPSLASTPPGPLVVHVPHSGTMIPNEVRSQLLLDDAGIDAELAAMTDWHTDLLAAEALDRSGVPATVFRNRLTRLVVDPERFPDEREVMAGRGMGAVYTSTSTLDPLRVHDDAVELDLLERFFHPYAVALADSVDAVLAAFGRCVLVDLHSYPSLALPYELDPDAPRPGICIGTDPAHTPDDLVGAASQAFDGVVGGVGLDSPFAGTYVPIRHYGADLRVSSVMIEIRRDLYLTEPSTIDRPRLDLLVDRLAAFLRSVVDVATT
jgi:N-formylglutamate deformylase